MTGLNRLCSWRAQGHPEAWRQDREKYKDLDRHSNSGADETPFANLTKVIFRLCQSDVLPVKTKLDFHKFFFSVYCCNFRESRRTTTCRRKDIWILIWIDQPFSQMNQTWCFTVLCFLCAQLSWWTPTSKGLQESNKCVVQGIDIEQTTDIGFGQKWIANC